MANLVRKEPRDVSRGAGPEYRWDPFRMIDALFRMDQLRGEWSGLASISEFVPRFDVKETKDAFVLKADLPGLKEGDVDVSLNGSQLTITGKREEEKREESDQYYAMERSYGSFTRSFMLPDSADAEHVSGELKDGVLAVHIPKRPETQPKKINIGKAAGEGKARA